MNFHPATHHKASTWKSPRIHVQQPFKDIYCQRTALLSLLSLFQPKSCPHFLPYFSPHLLSTSFLILAHKLSTLLSLIQPTLLSLFQPTIVSLFLHLLFYTISIYYLTDYSLHVQGQNHVGIYLLLFAFHVKHPCKVYI